jgi:multimeric flavodoxin WrbA
MADEEAGPAEARHLLVVSHSQTGGTRALVDALLEGATTDEVTGVEVRRRDALEADADDVRWAEALVIATPENFGYMSGAVKYFFDRTYYQVLEDKRGLPYALVVKGKHNDGSGAVGSIVPLVTGLGWREIRPPLVVIGDVTQSHLDEAGELGMSIAAGLEMGIY